MSIKHPPITPANISWQTDHAGLEVPVAQDFGDVYFSRDNGLAETQHVFLAGNNLAERFEALNDYDTFTIGELGFGTGLNVLAVWQLWLTHRNNKPNAKLHIITTEKFPLTKADLTRALASWTELADLSTKLISHYPPLIAGCHRLEFPDDNVSIDLWLGDAADSLSRVAAYTSVNAWFLDGFAPKCNEQLWADAALDQIQRLSGVGSTAATFSVAGVIKRGLAERGFDIAKIKGFGRKREMLTALVHLPLAGVGREGVNPELNSNSKHHTCAERSRSIAIIGSGIAGLCTAHSFAKRGHEVTLIDRDKPLAGSSGNPRAMLAPKLTPLHHVHEHMHSISYLYATRFYQTLGAFAERSRSEANENAQTSHQIIYEKTGVLDLLKTSNVTPEQISDYPEEFVSMVDAETASEKADSDLPESMYLPEAGLINPLALAEHILQHENITFVQADISKIATSDDGVTLWNADKQFITANHVVICTAHDCHLLSDQLPQPRSTRGQISWFDSDSSQATLPRTPLKYGGYCAPFTDDHGKSKHILGASFIRGTTDIPVNAEEHGQSRDKLVNALPQFANIQPSNTWQGRAGLRAQMPDYLPLVGQVSESVWSLAAMGSKGFAYAPICAEVIAAQMLGEVAPLPETLVAKLNPLRFKA